MWPRAGHNSGRERVLAFAAVLSTRATPEAITKELRKLPASAGPLDSRKRALHDLAHALAYVQENHKVIVCENCKNENGIGLLIQLLTDIDTAPPVPAGEDVIRVGRRVLGMGPMDARLYVLSCFVNLAYLGGAGQLRLPPDGLPYSGACARRENARERLMSCCRGGRCITRPPTPIILR